MTNDKDTSTATASLIFSILGVLPLLGFIFGTAGLIFGILALQRHYNEPETYGGEKRAIIALLIWSALAAGWLWALIYHPETLLNPN
jgi:succinate dehydrogenase/fumarate reductase cytochrome b subunit